MESRITYKIKNKNSIKSYVTLEEEKLENLLRKIEEENFTSKHRESWNWLMKSLLKGKIKNEKLQKWYAHFFNLLGNKLQTNTHVENKITESLFTVLGVSYEPFTLEEVKKAKKITFGKPANPDKISPDTIQSFEILMKSY